MWIRQRVRSSLVACSLSHHEHAQPLSSKSAPLRPGCPRYKPPKMPRMPPPQKNKPPSVSGVRPQSPPGSHAVHKTSDLWSRLVPNGNGDLGLDGAPLLMLHCWHRCSSGGWGLGLGPGALPHVPGSSVRRPSVMLLPSNDLLPHNTAHSLSLHVVSSSWPQACCLGLPLVDAHLTITCLCLATGNWQPATGNWQLSLAAGSISHTQLSQDDSQDDRRPAAATAEAKSEALEEHLRRLHSAGPLPAPPFLLGSSQSAPTLARLVLKVRTSSLTDLETWLGDEALDCWSAKDLQRDLNGKGSTEVLPALWYAIRRGPEVRRQGEARLQLQHWA